MHRLRDACWMIVCFIWPTWLPSLEEGESHGILLNSSRIPLLFPNFFYRCFHRIKICVPISKATENLNSCKSVVWTQPYGNGKNVRKHTTKSIPEVGRKQIPISMAIERVELVLSSQTLAHGYSKKKEDKKKQNKASKKLSTLKKQSGHEISRKGPAIARAYHPPPRVATDWSSGWIK